MAEFVRRKDEVFGVCLGVFPWEMTLLFRRKRL